MLKNDVNEWWRELDVLYIIVDYFYMRYTLNSYLTMEF